MMAETKVVAVEVVKSDEILEIFLKAELAGICWQNGCGVWEKDEIKEIVQSRDWVPVKWQCHLLTWETEEQIWREGEDQVFYSGHFTLESLLKGWVGM